jgi:hypothetical protein
MPSYPKPPEASPVKRPKIMSHSLENSQEKRLKEMPPHLLVLRVQSELDELDYDLE